MACLCERMYPNYAVFVNKMVFGDGQIYRRILDLIWGMLTVKDGKVNFDSQLRNLKKRFLQPTISIYAFYPAIDACVALSGTGPFAFEW